MDPETSPGAVIFDPLSMEFLENPYPVYRRLREVAPVSFQPELSSWWLTRYADCAEALKDRKFGRAFASTGQSLARPTALGGAPLPPSMLFLDGPDHARLRSLVNKAFTPRMIDRLRPRITKIVDDLLDGLVERSTFDLAIDFAYPLPATVIAEMLGVPAADQGQFRIWSNALVLGLDRTRPTEVRAAATAARAELSDYFAELIAERRAYPRVDLISDLIAVEEQGDKLSYAELIAMCNLLLVAGHETTTNLIANGALCLLRNPDQFAVLRERPEVSSSAIEEFLRFESPIQRDSRIVLEDVEIGGTRIPAGSTLVCLLGAANRDPEIFADPERLDITRANNQHLAFGKGPHFCLGASLARLEGQLAIAGLVTRIPNLTLADEPVWSMNFVFRTLRSLRVQA